MSDSQSLSPLTAEEHARELERAILAEGYNVLVNLDTGAVTLEKLVADCRKRGEVG